MESKFIIVLLVFIVLRISTIKAQAPSATVVSSPYNISRYEDSVTYDQAKAACIARNSWLVEIKDQQIQNAVTSLGSISGALQHSYWIGATDLDVEGVWKWNDGTPAVYTNWRDDLQPDNHQSEKHCGSAVKSGLWNDLQCSYTEAGYICQSDLNPVVFTGRTEFTVFLYNDQGEELRLNRDNAQSYCEGRGSTLASIYNAEIETALENQLQILTELSQASRYYLSGKGSVSGGIRWGDGTIVPTRPTTGYHNWAGDQPNDSGEVCIIKLSEVKRFGLWADVPCTDEVFFICQKDIPVSLSTQQQVVIAVKGDLITISLNVTTYDGPVSVRVYKEPDTNLLQTMDNIGNQTVSFQLGTADESHAGLYRFGASTNFTAYTATATAGITVVVRATIKNLSPLNIRVPVTTGSDHVTCIAYGIPTPTIQWIKDGVAVATSNTSNVYQTIQTTTAKLWIRNAEKSDAGTYTCRARNTIGRNQPEVSEERNVTFKILGSPSITKSENVPCTNNAAIAVTWQADVSTEHINHRFIITALNGTNIAAVYRNITSNLDGGIQVSQIMDLQYSIKYKIELQVCPDLCIVNLNATSEITTSILQLPGLVQEAVITQVSESTCFIFWRKPNENEQSQIQQYKVTVNARLVYISLDVTDDAFAETFNVSNQVTQFTLQTFPNRDYSVKIQTQTCAGHGPAVIVTGSCITQRAAPGSVPAPELLQSDNKFRSMKIKLPEETNGLISCLFLIMKLGEISTDFIFTINDLNQAQVAAKASSLADNAQYIAFTVTRIQVTGFITVNLGDNTKSFCNVNKTYGTKRAKRAEQNVQIQMYEATNWPIRDGQTYSYFTVTSTPVGDKILVKTSPVNTFVTPSGVPLAAIIAPIVIVILIGVVIGFVVNYKRRSSSQEHNQNQNPAYEERTTLKDDRTYELTEENENQRNDVPKQDNLYSSISDLNYQNVNASSQYENAVVNTE